MGKSARKACLTTVDLFCGAGGITEGFREAGYHCLYGNDAMPTDLYVGLDTGPTYIMSAFDIPLVVLYYCRIPSRQVAPLDHPCCYVLDHPRLDQRDCTEDTPMSEIGVEVVYAAVRKALTEHPWGDRAKLAVTDS